MSLKKWRKLNSKTVFKNDHWSYNLDEFEIEDGRKGEYHYVHTHGSSAVIPVKSNGKILLVNQYRYLNQKESLELPCGGVEENLSPHENALKELREESGFTSTELIYVGGFSPYTGASDEICSVFIAPSLVYSPLPKDEVEEFELHEFDLQEIDRLIEQNIIWDGLTITAFTLARKKLTDILDNIKITNNKQET